MGHRLNENQKLRNVYIRLTLFKSPSLGIGSTRSDALRALTTRFQDHGDLRSAQPFWEPDFLI